MKFKFRTISVSLVVAAVLGAALIFLFPGGPAGGEKINASQTAPGFSVGQFETLNYGKCSFNSDCHAGVKCCKNRCADSAGSCCSFNSDCGKFKGAKCNSGKCAHAPDGKCSFSSECPRGSCSGGKCR